MKWGFENKTGSWNHLLSCAEATEWKEQLFGLAVNLFAICSCNLIIDLVDGDLVSTCNRRDNCYGDQYDAYNSHVKYLVKSNQINV
jgi:hypothetical protein